ncbi:MAG: DNA mismatch repair endonuclease MutL [Lachnospiraceae bacterium]|jgi:DNA mismatch repair protein MutL|nr:DNA mismatch repair endonuclease MutL [Lachnospiraceae bacterium]
MPNIEILDQQTIDKIAAGEVVERPSSVVKELVENAIDAQASAITVEVKEGGISFIRITDNGCGMEKEQVPLAFLRHSTSKIRSVEDLATVSSLGFRGEALSSIAAVAQVELITKTAQSLSGVRYVIEGGKEQSLEEIGAPEGTTFLVRNLFYNTPARRKFLKTAPTEAGYIGSLMERLALSHPEVSFKLIVNNQPKLHTSGNSNLKEVIYHIYGRDIASNLIEVKGEDERFSVSGFIGKPLISRGNRNFENYFVNGRYVKSSLIAKSIEEAYKSFVMQHKYPFTVLQVSVNGNLIDVNVHPTKMELRFSNGEALYQFLAKLLRDCINQSELVYQVSLDREREEKARKEQERRRQLQAAQKAPEPFEARRLEAMKHKSPHGTEGFGIEPQEQSRREALLGANSPRGTEGFEIEPHTGQSRREAPFGAESPFRAKDIEAVRQAVRSSSPYEPKYGSREGAQRAGQGQADAMAAAGKVMEGPSFVNQQADAARQSPQQADPAMQGPQQADPAMQGPRQEVSGMGDGAARKLLDISSQKDHKMIGQVFGTYWLVEFDSQLYIIDQHAAHEKVLYERTLASLHTKEHTSQVIFPPLLLTLNMQEESLLKKYMGYFQTLGFEIEHFGGKEYSVTAVPGNLFGLNGEELVIEILDSLSGFHGNETPQVIVEKIASMSCKAAVKGNQRLSRQETEALIGELLSLENPYHCPHGRPTIISMSKRELEKKFKRVL